MFRDPRPYTRRWAAQHPLGAGVVMGTLFYIVEITATGDFVGVLPFAGSIGGIFWLTALNERRRRRSADRQRQP